MDNMKIVPGSNAGWVHVLLIAYNGMVIMMLAVFMSVTQEKIVDTMNAANFLKQVPILPLTSDDILLFSGGLFIILVVCGYCVTHINGLIGFWRCTIFMVEIAICILLMRTLNLSYDGIVLLVVADLMYRYEGKNQLFLLLSCMGVVYLVISYNVNLLHMKVVPFDLYLGYYSFSVQSLVMSLKNLLSYGNITLFVMYMVILIQDKRRENEEIARLNTELRLTNDQLNQSNSMLHTANSQATAANRKLREYAMMVASLTEIRERNRLAREIHDTLGHALTGIVAGADACMVTMDVAPAMAKKQLSKIRETAQHGIKDVRRSMHKLRPDDLEKLSLKDALTKMANDFSEAGSTKVDLSIVDFPDNLREDQSEVVYRILQEGMTNASRHGHAKNVGISVVKINDKLEIVIADDGIGCDKIKAGFGLHHMQERVSLLGGTLEYYSDNGFVLEVTLPLNE